MMRTIDLDKQTVRELNARLHGLNHEDGTPRFRILHPNGKHNIAVGMDARAAISIEGHAGHYVGGMNKHAHITVDGNAGAGLAENIMSGLVRVRGNASQYTGASGRGGLIVVEGDAAARCGISMKGVDIVVGGSVGHMGAFLGQAGNLVIQGDAGDALGDSILELQIFVQGKVKSLGHDCEAKEMGPAEADTLKALLDQAELKADWKKFRLYGPARRLYNFKIDHAAL